MNLITTNRPEASAKASARTVFVAPGRSRAARGFSLVELTMVLLVVVIIAGIAAPRYGNSIARYRIELAAKRVVTDLELASGRARTRSEPQTVMFKTASHAYVIPGLRDQATGAADHTVKLGADPYRALLKSVDFGGDADIVFNGFGLPDSAGEVIILQGPNERRVVIDENGGVTIQ